MFLDQAQILESRKHIHTQNSAIYLTFELLYNIGVLILHILSDPTKCSVSNFYLYINTN